MNIHIMITLTKDGIICPSLHRTLKQAIGELRGMECNVMSLWCVIII